MEAEESTGPRTWLTHEPVLVLNLNYVPINICNVRRAVILVGKGKAELLENGRGVIRTVTVDVDAPSVIRLVYLVKRPFLPRKLSKKEVFLRDRYTCQYCGKKNQDLTLDHVVPRSRGGPSTWENIVCACLRCTVHKGGRTPSEARMHLIRPPVRPRRSPVINIKLSHAKYHSWKQFLNHAYWTVELK